MRSSKVSDTADQPKPYQVRLRLLSLLDALEPGEALPPERQLAEDFGVSRSTVRQAVTDLVAAGLVQRVQGSGTYPVPPKVQLPLRLASYTRDVSEQGMQPTTRVVSLTKIAADSSVATALGVPVKSKVWRLERVRMTNTTPLAIECSHLPAGRYPDLGRLMKDDASLYSTLEAQYGVVITRAVQSVETGMATPDEYRLLEADASVPVLLLTRTTFDQSGEAFEYVVSTYRGDRCRLTAILLPQP